MVRVQVLDEGPGIPPDDLERIFDKFYRVRRRRPAACRHGLGLAICRGFVEAMGGTHRRRQPHRPAGRRVHHDPAGRSSQRKDAGGDACMTAGATPLRDARRR